MNWLLWVWYAVSITSMFYVIYQVNIGKHMTTKEIKFFFLGMFITGVPFVYLLSQ